MVVRTSITGLGGSGQMCAPIVEHHDDTELVAVCDLDESLLDEVAAPEKYTDHAEMIESEGIDLSIIATPPSVRTGPVETAVANDAAVLVEKPTALSTETLAELMAIDDEYEAPISAVQNVLFFPVMQTALDTVRRGYVGEVTSVDVHWAEEIDLTGAEMGQEGWVSEFYGGGITEGLPHFVYSALAFTDELDEVSVEWRSFESAEYPDGITVLAVDEADRFVTVQCLTRSNEARHVRVHGTEGSLHVDLDRRLLTLERGGDVDKSSASNAGTVPNRFRKLWSRGHYTLVDRYVTSIEDGSPTPPVALQDERDVVRVLELAESN